MIKWQQPETAPKDTSYFAVQTVQGDIQAWTYDQKAQHFRVLHIPGGGQTIATTTGTIARWARWHELCELIRGTPTI
jgi:hypothetical protein